MLVPDNQFIKEWSSILNVHLFFPFKEEALKPSEIKEQVSHAMREGNLYNDATTEEETEPEEEESKENGESTTGEDNISC